MGDKIDGGEERWGEKRDEEKWERRGEMGGVMKWDRRRV